MSLDAYKMCSLVVTCSFIYDRYWTKLEINLSCKTDHIVKELLGIMCLLDTPCVIEQIFKLSQLVGIKMNLVLLDCRSNPQVGIYPS